MLEPSASGISFSNGKCLEIANITLPVTNASESKLRPPKTNSKSFYNHLRSILSFLSLIQLEVIFFLLTFAIIVSRVSATTMILDKTCTVYFRYPVDVCENLQNFSDIKSEVEKVSANYQLVHTLIQTVPAIIVTVFIMPWSDKYSRKLPVLLSIAGTSFDTFGAALCSYNLNWGLEYYFIGTLFMGLCGGLVLMQATVYSLISDLTTVNKRTTKFALYEISQSLAQCLSVAAGGWIYDGLGYTAVFCVATICMLLTVLWIACAVPETRGIGDREVWQKKAKHLFSLKAPLEGLMGLFIKLPNNGRITIIMVIIAECILQTSIGAVFDSNYIYVHHQFNWSNSTYSNFVALYLTLQFMSVFLLLPLLKRFDVTDQVIAMLGCASLLAKYFFMGLAWNTTIFHLANVFGLLCFFGPCAFRSHLSKQVSKEDLGKVFLFMAIADGVAPMVAIVVISQLFNYFLDIYAGAPLLLLTIVLLMPFSIAIWISNLHWGLLLCRTGIKEKKKEDI